MSMNAKSMIFAAAVVALPLQAAAQSAAPPGAVSCSGCHADSAGLETAVPRLAGRDAADTIAAMQQFRAGQRPATVMDRLARGYTDADIQAIAAWYAAQK
jgi:cytochrome c553